jgi:hypothetical protein
LNTALKQLIQSDVPAAFLRSCAEGLQASFQRAHYDALTFHEHERARVLPQLRHYRQNAAFRDAAAAHGLECQMFSASPQGENFPLVVTGRLIIARCSLAFNNRRIPKARFRRQIAAGNRILEPDNLDFFDSARKKPSEFEPLGVLIASVSPHRTQAADLPAAIMVGVPHSDLSDWHTLMEHQELMLDSHEVVHVPDNAFVKLKKQMRRSEGKD